MDGRVVWYVQNPDEPAVRGTVQQQQGNSCFCDFPESADPELRRGQWIPATHLIYQEELFNNADHQR